MARPIEWNRRREDRVLVAREILERPHSYSDAAQEWAVDILGDQTADEPRTQSSV